MTTRCSGRAFIIPNPTKRGSWVGDFVAAWIGQTLPKKPIVLHLTTSHRSLEFCITFFTTYHNFTPESVGAACDQK